MRNHNEIPGSFECVQPELGDQIWRLELAETTSEMRLSLENHLAVCDSCRLTLAVEAKVAQGASEGGLKIGELPPTRARSNDSLTPLYFSLAGSLALAASLALALLMPPGQLDHSLVRGEDQEGFTRPVEGEILLQENPQLAWSAVPGATAYRVQISGVGNDFQWNTRCNEPFIKIPAEHPLPKNQDLRAVIQPVPDDLVPLGSISVSFRCEGPGSFFVYRMNSASLVLKLFGGLGLVFIGLGYFRSRTKTHSMLRS